MFPKSTFVQLQLLLLLGVAPLRSEENTYFNCVMAPSSGIHRIKLDANSVSFEVLCEKRAYDGDWTVVMNRFDGSVTFHNRRWHDYKNGFGHMSGEFFIGLDKLYALTNAVRHEALFVGELFNNDTFASMNHIFRIADETQKYQLLEVGANSGDGGDDFAYNHGLFCLHESNCLLPGWNMGSIGYGNSYIFGAYPETEEFISLRHGHIDLCWHPHRARGSHTCQLLHKFKWLIRPVNKYSMLNRN